MVILTAHQSNNCFQTEDIFFCINAHLTVGKKGGQSFILKIIKSDVKISFLKFCFWKESERNEEYKRR